MVNADFVQAALESLNEGNDILYALSYNSRQSCWSVLRLKRLDGNTGNYYGKYEISAFTNNHNELAEALRDALTLQAAGKR